MKKTLELLWEFRTKPVNLGNVQLVCRDEHISNVKEALNMYGLDFNHLYPTEYGNKLTDRAYIDTYILFSSVFLNEAHPEESDEFAKQVADIIEQKLNIEFLIISEYDYLIKQELKARGVSKTNVFYSALDFRLHKRPSNKIWVPEDL